MMDVLSTAARSTKSAAIICPPEECWPQIQAIRSEHDKAYERWMPHINLLFPFIEDSGETFSTAAATLTRSLGQVTPFRVAFTADSLGYFDHGKKCVLWLKPLLAAGETDTADLQTDTADLQTEQVGGIPTPQAVACDAPSIDNLRHAIWQPGDADVADTKQPARAQQDHTTTHAEEDEHWQTVARPKAKRAQKVPLESAAVGHHPSVLQIESIVRQSFPQLQEQESGKRAAGYQPHLTLGQFSKREITTVVENYRKTWVDFEFDVGEIFLISRQDFHDPFHIRKTVPIGASNEN